MAENIILAAVTVISTIRAVSYGVWTIRNKNTVGGISVIFMSLIALALVTTYFVSEII